MASEEIVQKVRTACRFGAGPYLTEEILAEVHGLVTYYRHAEALLLRIRNICNSDGTNPAVEQIRRLIDG